MANFKSKATDIKWGIGLIPVTVSDDCYFILEILINKYPCVTTWHFNRVENMELMMDKIRIAHLKAGRRPTIFKTRVLRERTV